MDLQRTSTTHAGRRAPRAGTTVLVAALTLAGCSDGPVGDSAASSTSALPSSTSTTSTSGGSSSENTTTTSVSSPGSRVTAAVGSSGSRGGTTGRPSAASEPPSAVPVMIRGRVASVNGNVVALVEPVSGYSKVVVLPSTEIRLSESRQGRFSDIESEALISVTGVATAADTVSAERVVVLDA